MTSPKSKEQVVPEEVLVIAGELVNSALRNYENNVFASVSRDAIAAALIAERKPPQWQPIETAPKGRKILAGYWNELGNWRTITARYYRELELDDYTGDSEDGYAPEGWYEEYESNEEIYRVPNKLSHWQELPIPPIPTPSSPIRAGEETA